MLAWAVEEEESPMSYLEYAEKEIKWKVEALSGWSIIMENVGYIMEELKRLNLRLSTEPNNSAKLLDHPSLYDYVLNQTERASVYKQLMNEHLALVNTKEAKMYKPK